jgi:ribonucleotide monophosphatase NagD (HAD superfamily)
MALIITMDKVVAHARTIFQRQGAFRPRFVSDIDGVLVRGTVPVDGTRDAVLALREAGIPLALLTNGGGYLEATKA